MKQLSIFLIIVAIYFLLIPRKSIVSVEKLTYDSTYIEVQEEAERHIHDPVPDKVSLKWKNLHSIFISGTPPLTIYNIRYTKDDEYCIIIVRDANNIFYGTRDKPIDYSLQEGDILLDTQ